MSELESDNLEYIILQGFIKSDKFYNTFSRYIIPEQFSDDNTKIIFQTVKEFYLEYRKMPTEIDMKEYIRTKYVDLEPHEYDSILNDMDTIYNKKFKITEEFLNKRSETFVKTRNLMLILKAVHGILKEKDEEKLAKSLPAIYNKIKKNVYEVDVTVKPYYNIVSSAEEIYNQLTERKEVMRSSITKLNQYIGGGFTKGAMTVIVSPSNGGKSAFMTSIMCNALKSGKKVLAINLEMNRIDYVARILSNITDTEINEILKFKKAKEDFIRLLNENAKILNNAIVVDIETNMCSVNTIKNMLEELKNNEDNPFVPDMIVVDYLELMRSDILTDSERSNTYNYYKSISQELQGYAKDMNIAVVTAQQLTREAYKLAIESPEKIDMDNTQGSMGIAQSADLMIAVSKLNKQPEYVNISIIKNRFGLKTEKPFQAKVTYSKMRYEDTDREFNLEDDKDTKSLQKPITKPIPKPMVKQITDIDKDGF